MSIVIFIIILAVLVFVHELGHFSLAKLFGIKVEEFGIGFPPRIFAFKKGETEYSINMIPLGGFVKILGENGLEETEGKISSPSPNHFASKNRLIQTAVLGAGITANLILAWLLISFGFMSGLPAPIDTELSGNVRDAKLTITQVVPGSPAEKAGLKSGDAINNIDVPTKDKVPAQNSASNLDPEKVRSFIENTNGKEFEIAYTRGSNNGLVSLKAEKGIIEGRYAIGIGMDMIGTLKLSVMEAFYVGAMTTFNLAYATTIGLGHFAYQAILGQASINEVSGPIGIAGLVGSAADLGFTYLLSIMAFISINLAIINLIPFPALDGGRILFVAIEAIKRSPINPKVVNTVNGIGFALLILLMIVVSYNDIIKLI